MGESVNPAVPGSGDALQLTTTLEPLGPAGAFVLTDEQVAALGQGRKTFPVLLTYAGTTVGLRLSRMGGKNLIGLRREIRDQLGLELGQTAAIEVVMDVAERTVEVPADLAQALAGQDDVRAAFEGMAYSHRKEYVRWITEAKREQTRADRIAKAVEMIRAGQTR